MDGDDHTDVRQPITAAAHVPDHHPHCDYDKVDDFHEDSEDIEDDAVSTCVDNLLSSNAAILLSH